MKDVVAFAERNAYQLTGTTPPPMTDRQFELLEFAVHTRNYSKIADVFYQEALQGDREGLLTLLFYLSKHHINIATIADEVVKPALMRIGAMWSEGELEISREHLASQAVTEALVRLAPELHRKPSNGYTAACACAEGEFHEIGLRNLAFALETEGWKVHYIGSNTPFDSLHTFIKKIKPDLFCLSVTVIKNKPEFFEGLREMQKLLHAAGGKFIVGGFYAPQYSAKDLHCDYVSSSVLDATAYAKDVFHLRPGPKKKRATA
jgi:methanogenic corrinoid protein MtbC1